MPADSAAPTSDIIIVGAGPAGCTLAARLAAAGWRVTLCDQRATTEPVIGESLLPWCGRVLDRLGVDMSGFIEKHGAVFAWADGARRFPFAEAVRAERPFAWEVPREDFDARLRQVALDAGAQLRVGRIAQIDAGRVVDADGVELRAPIVVDAAGRNSLLARRLGLRRNVPGLRNAAVARRFTGVHSFDPEQPGDIAICPFDGGWFWFIPFADGQVSVGLVTTPDSGITGDRWAEALRRCPAAAMRLLNARPTSDQRGHADFTFVSDSFHGSEDGKRWILLSDAAMFLDPVFSSGILFSLEGADRLADALLRPEADRDAALNTWEADLRAASLPMLQAIRNFYAGGFEKVALTPRELQPDKVRASILSLLAGDVFWPDDNRAAHRIAPMLDAIAERVDDLV